MSRNVDRANLPIFRMDVHMQAICLNAVQKSFRQNGNKLILRHVWHCLSCFFAPSLNVGHSRCDCLAFEAVQLQLIIVR